jgi:hypothetical protein
VLEAVFILLEFPSHSRRIFISSQSLPPLWFAVSVLHVPASVCTSRTVRVVGADRPRGEFFPGVLRVLRVFLSAFVLIRLASGFWWKVLWRTVHRDVVDSPRDTSCSWIVRRRGTDRLRVEVPVGSSCQCLMDRPLCGADRPRGGRGQSAPGPRTVRLDCCRTAKSFASWFVLPLWDRLGFVPRVGTFVVTT